MSRFDQEYATEDVRKAQSQIGHLPMANLIGGLAAAEQWGAKITELSTKITDLEKRIPKLSENAAENVAKPLVDKAADKAADKPAKKP